MKKIILLLFFLFIALIPTSDILAACNSTNRACEPACVSPQVCRINYNSSIDQAACYCETPTSGTSGGGSDIWGTIENPIKGGPLSSGQKGLVTFLNNVLRLIFVVAGIYSLIQIVIAGFGFITAGGDAKIMERSWNTIWQSILGLIVIIGSLALAAIMGLLLFGNATAILNPQIYGPGTTP